MTVLDDSSAPITLSNPKFDIVERDQNTRLFAELYVKDVLQETIDCEFGEKQLTLKFQTTNQAIHKEHGSENVNRFFCWKPKLKGMIVPSSCKVEVRPTKISITLCKTSTDKWDSLLDPISVRPMATITNVQNAGWISLQAATPSAVENHDDSDNLNATSSEPIVNGNFKPLKTKRLGYVGLDNIGNTCFMNSVIQCLANTRELKEYFDKPNFGRDLNRNNPLGMGGMCALSFSALLRKLWLGDEYSIGPKKLKELIGEKVPQFAGTMQHDAQEFLTFLLDAVHEDLNRIKQKPYIEDRGDCEDKGDILRAEEVWNKHKMRNDSVVVDLFHGQFKSCLQCPECNKKSVTFDPFVSLSIPIPPLTVVHKVHLFFSDAQRQPEKHYLEVNAEATGYQLKLALSSRVGIPLPQLEVCDVSAGEIRVFIANDVYVRNPNFLVAYELANLPDVDHFVVTQRLLTPQIPEYCDSCHQSLPKTAMVLCPRCKAGYCSERCKTDCSYAHFSCKSKPKYKHAGIPFVISIPSEGIQLEQLQKEVLKYVHLSVKVTPLKHGLDLDMNSNEGSENELSEFFFMKCLQLSGEPSGARFTKDTIVIPTTKFLSVDWRCNPESPYFCKVEEKYPAWKVSGSPSSFRTSLSLQDCLELFHEPETLSKEEAWYCPSCKQHVQATKQMSIWTLPKVLVIHLKRFSFRSSYSRSKVDTCIDFPLAGLDLSPFVNTESVSTIYDLYGVVNHMGSMYGGHYTACARLPHGKATDFSEIGWRLFDDSSVDNISEESICSKDAYILFYVRRESPIHDGSISNEMQTFSSPNEIYGSSSAGEFESDTADTGASENEDFRSMD